MRAVASAGPTLLQVLPSTSLPSTSPKPSMSLPV
jgi:hypothetical protein